MRKPYGQVVPGLTHNGTEVRAAVFNENQVRAAAGLTMALGAVAFAYANWAKVFGPIKFVTAFFLVDFGIRVTANGHRAWVLRYRTKGGVQRTYPIGEVGDAWSAAAARERAAERRRDVDSGGDPAAQDRKVREAPTVRELADRFDAEHIAYKRPLTQREYRALLSGLRPGMEQSRASMLP